MPIRSNKSVPLDEQIARLIERRLKTVQPSSYGVHIVEVVRPSRRDDYTPFDGVAVLQSDSYVDGDDATDTQGLIVTRRKIWTIDYFIEPSDDDDRPIDLLQSIAIAEIERALWKSIENTPHRAFDGLGYEARVLTPQLITAGDNATAGVRVSVEATYSHLQSDPYTPMI